MVYLMTYLEKEDTKWVIIILVTQCKPITATVLPTAAALPACYATLFIFSIQPLPLPSDPS